MLIFKKIAGLSLPPLVPWCGFFCFGISLEYFLSVSFIPLCIVSLLLLIFSFVYLKNNKRIYFFLFCIAFFLGALSLAHSKVLPRNSISRIVPSTKQDVTFRGIIVSDPILLPEKTSFILSVSQLTHDASSTSVSGKILVRRPAGEHFSYGDELLIEGGLYRPYNSPYLKSQGIYGILNSKKDDLFKEIRRNRADPLKSFAIFLQHRMDNVLSSSLAPSAASLLQAMLLGEAGKVPASVKDMMIKTGTWHILVVSGSHTTLVAFIFILFFKFFRLPQRPRYGLTVLVLIIYCFLTGGSIPVVRATIMSILFLVSYLIERKPLLYNTLALSALVILFSDPAALFNAGFQLSFLSVFFIVWLYPKINIFVLDKIGCGEKRALSRNFWQAHMVFPLVGCFSVSLAAWIGTAPIIAFTFGNFSLITVFANMAVVPLAMLAVTAGFVLLIAGSLFLPLALLLGISCDFLIFLFLKVNLFFAQVPGAFLTLPPFPLVLVFIYYVIVLVLFNEVS